MITLDDVIERAAIMEHEGKQDRNTATKLAFQEVMGNMPYDAETVIFAASPPDDESIAAARAFVKERGFTSDDVALKKHETAVYVILKRAVEIG